MPNRNSETPGSPPIRILFIADQADATTPLQAELRRAGIDFISSLVAEPADLSPQESEFDLAVWAQEQDSAPSAPETGVVHPAISQAPWIVVTKGLTDGPVAPNEPVGFIARIAAERPSSFVPAVRQALRWRDLTRQCRQLEQRVEELELAAAAGRETGAKLQAAIESLAEFPEMNPNPVLEFSEDAKIRYCNEAARELARSVGRSHPQEILPPDTEAIVAGCLASACPKLRVESSLGGRTFFWSYYPISKSRVIHCYVSDATERLRLEAQLRHAQKLESIGRLAAGVAHDFNNILTVIQGHTSLIRMEDGLPERVQASLRQLAQAAERGSKLTSQLMVFSRKNLLQRKTIDLQELLTGLSQLLARTLGEDINIQYHYTPSLPSLLADSGMLEQAVMNLAINAREAMTHGGQLVIGTAVENIEAADLARHSSESRIGKFVCLTIMDTGRGMDPATLGRIFEPFFTTKEVKQGAGLGLASVYGIITQHLGWIEVQSQVGAGTVFKIYLPTAPTEPQRAGAAKQALPPPAGAGTETVMLVEDDAPVRWIVKDALIRHGYKVLEAGSGIEALAVWHQHWTEVGLLLTDVVMPVGLTGEELAEKFKAQKPDLKVMYISGYSAQTAGSSPERFEGRSFLQKPFDPGRLATAVRQCLDA